MANKVWIVMLGIGALVFAGFTIGAVVWAIAEHEWRALASAIYLGLMTQQCVNLTRRRIKYGPNGPPPNSLENFHVDF